MQHPSRWRGSLGTGRAWASGHAARHRACMSKGQAHQSGHIQHPPPAVGAGAGHQTPHTPQRQASRTQRVSSAADKGAKGNQFSRPFPGPCVRVRCRGHRIPHQGKQQRIGGTVQARGQQHRQHRPKTSKPWAGRSSLEQNTKTGHQRQRFRQSRQKPAKANGEGKRKRGRIYVNE